jgi:ABC-type bacteriocin/lantibiotic exporter with double-glycine peptidase domain
MTSEIPKLIDFQTGHNIMNTLRQCHETRVLTYSYVFNIVILILFIVIAIITLYVCFTRKKTPDEKKKQMEQEQKFILEKIKSLKEQKQYYLQEETFTKLPLTG